MSTQCSIIPKVINNSGEKTDSKLFKDLLSFSKNRQNTVKVYTITKNIEFENKYKNIIKLDNNNEPIFSSLIEHVNVSKYIPDKNITNRILQDLDYYNPKTGDYKYVENTIDNSNDIQKDVIDFNRSSEFKNTFTATIKKITNDNNKEKITLDINRKNNKNKKEAKIIHTNYLLNQKLKEILKDKGISIGALTDLEEKLKINGVTDFSVAKKSAEGFIELIRLAKGERGEAALPEEFAHASLEMLSDNPLVKRLINLIYNKNLAKEIIGEDYDTYYLEYKGDNYKLAKEAAGKLLAKHLIKTNEIENNKPYKNILLRAIQAIKNFFSSFNSNQFRDAIIEANKGFDSLAKSILKGDLTNQMRIENISESSLFYSVTDRIKRDHKLLKDIIDVELKRLEIYTKRNKNENENTNKEFENIQREHISQLMKNLEAHSELEGINIYLERTLKILGKLSDRLNEISNDESLSINQKAGVLRNIKNYLNSYSITTQMILNSVEEESKLNDNRYTEKAVQSLKDSMFLLGKLYNSYSKVAIPLFKDFLKPFVGEGIEVYYGKNKGKKLGVDELLENAERDISFFDRWLDAMADSSDHMLRVLDNVVKKRRDKSWERQLALSKKITALGIELEQAGIRSTDWMFERDSEGNLTDNYISELNWTLYKENKKKFIKRLKEKYGENLTGENLNNYRKELRAWYEENTEEVDNKIEPKAYKDKEKRIPLYVNTNFPEKGTPKRKFYDAIIDIKKEMDSFVGVKDHLNTIKIRKDFMERIKSSKDVISGIKQIWESTKDEFIRRSDDSDFGTKSTLIDFNDSKVQTLPIYYINRKKGENPNDISTDVVSTMLAYSAMAIDYDEMSKIINILEVGKDILLEREVEQHSGKAILSEKFTQLGHTVENKLTKESSKTNIGERLLDFFDMQIYHKYMKDEGTIGPTKMDKGKTANNINTLTILSTLAVNGLSGLVNASVGHITEVIEAAAGKYYNRKELLKADKIYSTNIMSNLAEINNRIKTNKLSLWLEKFNVLHDADNKLKDFKFNRRNFMSKLFGMKTLLFFNNAGEHWLNSRSSIAMALHYKLKDKNGNDTNLWEAMEIKFINPNNPKLGANLVIKEGTRKLDGTLLTEEDLGKERRKMESVSHMHGIYNEEDKAAAKKLALGRLALLYKNYLKPNLNKRFKKPIYNMDLEELSGGYYYTTGVFLLNIIKDLRNGQILFRTRYKELDSFEKENFKRAIEELSIFLAISIALCLLFGDDDDEESIIKDTVEYSLRRTKTEMGALMPVPTFLQENYKMLQRPVAATSYTDHLIKTIEVVNPYSYETFGGEDAIVQSGRYEGYNEASKVALEAIPMNKTIYRMLHPEEAIPFYK